MYKTIILPIDINHNASGNQKILDAAKTLMSDETEVILLHVMENIPGYIAMQIPEGIHENFQGEAVDKLNSLAKEAGITADAHIRHGAIATEILEFAEQKNADLIILASHKPELQDYLLGSTAARVIRHAKCSVFTIR